MHACTHAHAHTLCLIMYCFIVLHYYIDTPSNSKMLAMLLKSRGVDSKVVVNGQLAVDAVTANTQKYDMIFMDFTMPVMVSN
jgi:CheY-like chemotaxis protein